MNLTTDNRTTFNLILQKTAQCTTSELDRKYSPRNLVVIDKIEQKFASHEILCELIVAYDASTNNNGQSDNIHLSERIKTEFYNVSARVRQILKTLPNGITMSDLLAYLISRGQGEAALNSRH